MMDWLMEFGKNDDWPDSIMRECLNERSSVKLEHKVVCGWKSRNSIREKIFLAELQSIISWHISTVYQQYGWKIRSFFGKVLWVILEPAGFYLEWELSSSATSRSNASKTQWSILASAPCLGTLFGIWNTWETFPEPPSQPGWGATVGQWLAGLYFNQGGCRSDPRPSRCFLEQDT